MNLMIQPNQICLIVKLYNNRPELLPDSNDISYKTTTLREIKVLHHGRRDKSLFKYGLEYIAQCLLNHMNRYRIDIFKLLSYT